MASTTDLAAKFIAKVWSAQPHHDGLYGVLATKDWDTGEWANHAISLAAGDADTEAIEGADDLYFTPCLFSKPSAKKAHAEPSRVLYADLDEVDPRDLDIPPSLAWETSPGRYQALWMLDRALNTKTFERLNQRLTYATGADKGGWSATKVLRVPGSRSTKYEKPFRVRLIKITRRRRYTVEEMRALLKDIPTALDAPGTLPPSDTLPDPDDTFKQRRKIIPVRARQLLNTKSLVNSDDRSARLWELQTLLINAGLEPEEVYVLVKRSIWNKYKGQRRESTRLWYEISKAKANAAEPDKPKRKKAKDNKPRERKYKREMVVVSDFRQRTYKIPTWLVNQLWTRGAFGFLAGESKTYKSLLALDMAVSVSSGTPFLSHFQIPAASQGPVLLWQEENDEGLVQERLRRIEFARGLGPTSAGYKLSLSGRDYPLHFGNRQAIDLNDDKDLKYIHRQIHKYSPRLVILDPLYMMIPTLDESEASAITPMLRNLAKIQTDTKTSILVVHHYRKPQQQTKGRAMHRMSGTGVFGRRYDSAIWVEVMEEEESKPVIRVSSSHRAQAAGGAYVVSFDMPDDEDMSYTATVRPWTEQDDLEDEAGRTQMVLDGMGAKKPKGDLDHLPLIEERTRLGTLAREMNVSAADLRDAYKDAGFTIVRGASYNNGKSRHLEILPLDPQGAE